LLAVVVVLIEVQIPHYWEHLCFSFYETRDFESISMIIYWISMLTLAITSYTKKLNLIPSLGIASCGYLLTGMQRENWFWFFIWFGIGLVFYFSYGFRKSKLAQNS
jgi:hypothetical protein